MWGVGQERHVVGTGLVGPGGDERGRDASARLGFGDAGTFMQDVGNSEARRVLGMVFEVGWVLHGGTPSGPRRVGGQCQKAGAQTKDRDKYAVGIVY